jgi:hypothetical protein
MKGKRKFPVAKNKADGWLCTQSKTNFFSKSYEEAACLIYFFISQGLETSKEFLCS